MKTKSIAFPRMLKPELITWDAALSTRPAAESVQFVDALNDCITWLQDEIDTYNKTHDLDKKKQQLIKIERQTLVLQSLAPEDIMTSYPDYDREILHTLFTELKTQTDIFEASASISALDFSVARMLQRMSPDRIAQLLLILSAGASFDQSKLDDLCFPGADAALADECRMFYDFLKMYRIRFLGGGNAQNFMIVHVLDPGDTFVLKVENRLGMPKHVERTLRDAALSEVFMPLHAERQATFIDQKIMEKTTCFLVLTSYCAGDSLEKYGHKPVDPDVRLDDALHFFTQMADILVKMSAINCAFPDIKNSNWLVDEKKRLRLSDTKSVIATQQDGSISRTALKREGFNVIYTCYMHAPEEVRNAPFSADKMHVYLLGKSMYHYLSQCNTKYLLKIKPEQFDYEYPVFKDTPFGILLKDFIIETTKELPADRLTLDQAFLQLREIWLSKLMSALPPATKEDIDAFLASASLEHPVAEPFSLGLTASLHFKAQIHAHTSEVCPMDPAPEDFEEQLNPLHSPKHT